MHYFEIFLQKFGFFFFTSSLFLQFLLISSKCLFILSVIFSNSVLNWLFSVFYMFMAVLIFLFKFFFCISSSTRLCELGIYLFHQLRNNYVFSSSRPFNFDLVDSAISYISLFYLLFFQIPVEPFNKINRRYDK